MRKIYKYRKPLVAFFMVTLFSEMLAPFAAYALTGGPSQPEVQSFEDANTTTLVDNFTGDFVYNIPLMDVGGYPLNISYHSGVTMDQEASMVGLGWNFNPGAITRNMRGLPDDFMGDPISKEYNINRNWTAGVDLGVGIKFTNISLGLNENMGVYYNNYRGVGFTGSTGFQYSFTLAGGGDNTTGLAADIGLSLSFDSQNGIGVSPSMGLSLEANSTDKEGKSSMGCSLSTGMTYNSRSGISALTVSADASANTTATKDGKTEEIGGLNMGGNSTISFASQAVTPTIEFPMTNFSFSGKFQIGGELNYPPWLDISGNITGNYSEEQLLYNTDTIGGYGYLYFDQAHQQERALLDFNREKDQPFRKPRPAMHDEGTPVMAIPNFDYDLFSVAGQGIGGNYRIQRADVGAVYDHKVDYTSGSGNISADVGIGAYVHLGFNLDGAVVNTETGNWMQNNQLYNNLGFSSYNNTAYEPASFVNIGEKPIAEQNIYNEYGGDDPFNVVLGGDKFYRQATRTIQTWHNGVAGPTSYLSDFKRPQRDKRNQAVSYLTADEAQYGAIDTAILNYPLNCYPIDVCNGLPPSVQQINRVAQANGKKHHISELTVLGTDGRRYVYGLPAYNRKHREATFNVDESVGNVYTGLADYQALGTNPKANSINNNFGLDHFFSAENIPDYAHSYLLTSVLSADYVDLTGNGPSDDDYGDYVKMNYTRVYPSNDANSQGQLYNWRVPYNQANYQQGYKSYPCDKKANYLYGSKEIWYINSIESKTMVAVFHLSDREDAVGAKDEDGGMGPHPARLKKLDRIDLYSKPDLEKNGRNAIPVKSVFFVYDYSLCPHVDNNTGNPVNVNGQPTGLDSTNVNANAGKLTLKEVYFTYQNNTKGKLNPYVFHYDQNINPPYHIKHYDRWGNYKSNQEYAGGGSFVPDAEYPYTIQDTTYTNKAAGAWSLSQIDLPTGGSIHVKLESDAYAYVQNLPAMQMYQVLGMGNDTSVIDNRFYTSAEDADQNNYLFVKVNVPIASTTYPAVKTEILNKYLAGITHLYYQCAIKMYDTDPDSVAEYVPGYCHFVNYGLLPGSNNILWLQLQPQPKGNSGPAVVNPIVKNAWQFLRINLPSRAYPGSYNVGCNGKIPGALAIMKSLIAPIFDIENMLMGFADACIIHNRCKYIVPSNSWVRLNTANGSKLGGGARVKQVTITDNWNQMAPGGSPAVYGQVYSYKMPDGTSSGVAEFEPNLGGNENPFRQPLLYNETSILSPNTQLYMEYPLCESFYPAPGVGYRQVTVTSFGSTQVPVNKQTGYTIHKFYTAYDFPVITDYTPKSYYLDNTFPLLSIFKMPITNDFTGSQGFAIQLNDMHGKPKSEEVYDNTGSVISKTSYTYQTDNPGAVFKKLNNNVTVLNRNGTISTAEIGRNADVFLDYRSQNSQTYNIGLNISVDISPLPGPLPFPIPVFMILPVFGMNNAQFESVSSMKVIHRYGILQSVTAQQYGSTVTTTNQVYDSETGDVLLTKTQNEFNDPVYSFKYPAHLAYNGMGPAYLNIDAKFTNVQILNGLIQTPLSINQYFTAGDEILAQIPTGYQKLWVIDPNSNNPSAAHQKIFIDQYGNSVSDTYPLMKIIRSGHRNMQSASIGSITSLSDPTAGGTLNPLASTGILNTEATQYKETWKVNCDQIPYQQCDTCPPISCDCMHNLLKQMIQNNLWYKQARDSAYVTLCCLDSGCAYPDGTPSGPAGCKNLVIGNLDPFGNVYYASIGSYRLTIVKDGSYGYSSFPIATVNSLQLLNENDLAIIQDSCQVICGYYGETGKYYMPSIVSGQPPVPYYAYLTHMCKPRQICINLPTDTVINPYRYGLLGNWRPYRKWIYRDFRTPDALASTDTPGIRHNGIFDTYSSFWTADTAHHKFVVNPALATQYVDATTITKYDTKGDEIENQDAAGIYSSAIYGYLETLATGVAKNARYKDIANDNFEDYDFTTDCSTPCVSDHFSFRQSLAPDSITVALIDNSTAHSGNRSLKVLGASPGTASVTRDIIPDNENPGLMFDSVHNRYLLVPDGCLPKFSPDSGKYYVSVWVKEPANCNVLTYGNSSLSISFTGSSQTYVFTPHGNIIEGWQKIDSVFTVPGSATQIKVALNALHGVNVNFDDIRIEPFNSEMKTYVYDWRTMRIMATLDENNYAVFYEYDDRGTPVRLKKETERGIMTIQETRSTLKAK